MKARCSLILLGLVLMIGQEAIGNPIQLGVIEDAFQFKQNVCLVFQGYFSSGPYRLERTMDSQTIRIMDDWEIPAEDPLKECGDYRLYIFEDACVPAGQALYTLFQKMPSGWDNAGSETIQVEDSGEECGNDDDCAALIDPDEYLPCNLDDDDNDNDDGCGC